MMMNADLVLATCPLFALEIEDHICPQLCFAEAADTISCHHQHHHHHQQQQHPIDPSSSSAPEEATCFATGSCSCFIIILTAVLGLYILLALVMNMIACYNFVVAWNLITRMYHVDLTFMSRRHHQQQQRNNLLSSSSSSSLKNKSQQRSLVHVDGRTDSCCPVCLEEFHEEELVTACDDGCRASFHKDCLFEWLDRSDSCPCCRRDMLAQRPRGWCHDLSVFLGYAPR